MTEPCKHLTLGDRVRITRDITEYREQFNFKAGMLGTIVGVLAQNPGSKEDAFDVHPDSYPKGWEIPLDTSVLEHEGAASQSPPAAPPTVHNLTAVSTEDLLSAFGAPFDRRIGCDRMRGAASQSGTAPKESTVQQVTGSDEERSACDQKPSPESESAGRSREGQSDGKSAQLQVSAPSATGDAAEFYESLYGRHDPRSMTYAELLYFANAYASSLREEIERLRKVNGAFAAIGEPARRDAAAWRDRAKSLERELADLRAQLAGKG